MKPKVTLNFNANNLMNVIQDAAKQKKYNISCPHCNMPITVNVGKSVCPHCGKPIDLSLNFK